MPQKCVHKGCGKTFTDPKETCVYHPGPPNFHEGQKGWKCCKPRVLTFDEFLTIPPCTTGQHSTVDDTPQPEPKPQAEELPSVPAPKPIATDSNGSLQVGPVSRAPQAALSGTPSPAPPESEDDDPSLPIPPNTTCRRRGCNASSSGAKPSREGEECTYHPGQALFHEGSKGWTCCKRRVLEFDEFMKIQGCKTKDKHLFVGIKKDTSKVQAVNDIRHDFYQTSTSVIASLFLKKIDKERARVEFSSSTTVHLDLPTTDNKRYTAQLPLFGLIDTAASKYKILATKLELTLVKMDGVSWRTLRSDEQSTSEIVQVGRAGRA